MPIWPTTQSFQFADFDNAKHSVESQVHRELPGLRSFFTQSRAGGFSCSKAASNGLQMTSNGPLTTTKQARTAIESPKIGARRSPEKARVGNSAGGSGGRAMSQQRSPGMAIPGLLEVVNQAVVAA
jgi:hypothetical protein